MSRQAIAQPYARGEWGDLHDVLADAFPRLCNEYGELRVRDLAERMEVTHECAYKWLRANKMPVRQVLRIIKMTRERVTLNDFDGLFS